MTAYIGARVHLTIGGQPVGRVWTVVGFEMLPLHGRRRRVAVISCGGDTPLRAYMRELVPAGAAG